MAISLQKALEHFEENGFELPEQMECDDILDSGETYGFKSNQRRLLASIINEYEGLKVCDIPEDRTAFAWAVDVASNRMGVVETVQKARSAPSNCKGLTVPQPCLSTAGCGWTKRVTANNPTGYCQKKSGNVGNLVGKKATMTRAERLASQGIAPIKKAKVTAGKVKVTAGKAKVTKAAASKAAASKAAASKLQKVAPGKKPSKPQFDTSGLTILKSGVNYFIVAGNLLENDNFTKYLEENGFTQVNVELRYNDNTFMGESTAWIGKSKEMNTIGDAAYENGNIEKIDDDNYAIITNTPEPKFESGSEDSEQESDSDVVYLEDLV